MSITQFDPIPKDDINCAAGFTRELLPCPFCGGKAITHGGINERTKIIVYTVQCDRCMASLFADSKDGRQFARNKAIEKWNTRAR